MTSNSEESGTVLVVRRRTRASVTKSRRGMKRPIDIAKTQAETVQVQITKPQTTQTEQVKESTEATRTFDMSVVNERMRKRAAKQEVKEEQPMISAQEIKEQEIQKAILATNRSFAQQKKSKRHHYKKMGFGFRKVALALAFTAVSVFAIVYFVQTSSPDESSKVTAIQNDINAHYPNYVPRGFSLSDVTSEKGKITLNFRNNESGDAFLLIEEKVSWGQDDLLNNFVKPNYGDNYMMISENNLDVYINGSNAAWVKDDIFYRIVTTAGSLTKKQLSTIAIKL